jgi:hypothetical protein
MDAGIRLETLRKAAKGLDCELVYALVPCKGTLEEMASRQKAARDEARAQKREEAFDKMVAERKPWLEAIGWREALLDSLRVALRREGVRIRPRKTDWGDARKREALNVAMKLAELTVSAEDLEEQGIGTRE